MRSIIAEEAAHNFWNGLIEIDVKAPTWAAMHAHTGRVRYSYRTCPEANSAPSAVVSTQYSLIIVSICMIVCLN